MAVNPTPYRRQYTASDGQTTFEYPFLIFEAEDLNVYLTPAGQAPNPGGDILALNVDYTVTGVLNKNGGTVVLTTGANANDTITINGNIQIDRETDFITGGDFKSATVNNQFDKLTVICQQLHTRMIQRMLTYGVTDELDSGDTTLPKLAPGQLWRANGAGDLVAVTFEENPDWSTLRSELASETESAPGAELVGYYNPVSSAQKTVNQELKDIVSNLADETEPSPGAALVGYYDTLDESNTTVDAALKKVINRVHASNYYNYIINGDFNIWQRGTSYVFNGSGGAYTADRWRWSQGGGDTTISRQTLSASQYNNVCRIERSTAAGASPIFAERIEKVDLLADTSVAITFTTILRTGAPLSIEVKLQQFFGTGGSPSAPVDIEVGEFILDATLAVESHSFTVNVPSTSGKTLGSNGDDYLELQIWPVDKVYTLDLTAIIVARSNHPVIFYPRLFQQEIALCHRYYEKSYPLPIDPGSVTSEGAIQNYVPDATHELRPIHSRFMVPKRDMPTITWYSPDTGTAGDIYVATYLEDATVEQTDATSTQSTGFPVILEEMLGNTLFSAHWIADSEL